MNRKEIRGSRSSEEFQGVSELAEMDSGTLVLTSSGVPVPKGTSESGTSGIKIIDPFMEAAGDTRWCQRFRLPWPPPILSPNYRSANWAPRWAAARRYRGSCLASARAQILRAKIQRPEGGWRIAAHALFHPPDRRLRDLDNALGAIKYALDGLAEALGVNDRQFRPWIVDWGPVASREGVVELTLLGPPGALRGGLPGAAWDLGGRLD